MKEDLKTRNSKIKSLILDIKDYRLSQIEKAIFEPDINTWLSITTLPKDIREKLDKDIAFLSYKDSSVTENEKKDTFKALLTLWDNHKIETVLMRNVKNNLTACISTEIGCPTGCVFCATGDMGLVRNLNSDEIIDQLRFWQQFIREKKRKDRISNLVFMGMGEPLLNYDNTRDALSLILKYTDIGKNHITVSTVGIIQGLRRLLKDPLWPDVRIAISLQSADFTTRTLLVPKTPPDFYSALIEWARNYCGRRIKRNRFLTIEYVMLENINDTPMHLEKLKLFLKKLPQVKVNLIRYNTNPNKPYLASNNTIINDFKSSLEGEGFKVTLRESKGSDIAAACGQLLTG